MSGKKFTHNPPAAKPKRPSAERVVSERGRKELPPGTKGGENLKPDRHYEHKQHAFDSYCKKVLKYEAYNGYREISRRQKCEALFSELSEEELAQLAVYDRYSWEYTAFPVGGAVILIEDHKPVAGCRIAFPDEKTGKIERVCVVRGKQKGGYGRILIQEAENWLKEYGVNHIVISSQDRAAGFYEKLGYQLNPDVDPSVYDKHHKQEEKPKQEPSRPKNAPGPFGFTCVLVEKYL
mgnify:CR=1 FL=1